MSDAEVQPKSARRKPEAKAGSDGGSASKPRTRAKAKIPAEPAVTAKSARIEEGAASVAPPPASTDTLAPDASPIPAALPTDKGLGWASTVIVTATAFLFVFNAPSLKSWADQQAPNRATVAIRNLADGWYVTTERLGLSAPRDALHEAWNKAVAATWGGGDGNSAGQ